MSCIVNDKETNFEKRVKKRAYYMSLNGEYSSDEERYFKAKEIELDLKQNYEKIYTNIKHYNYEKRLEYYDDILTEDQKEVLKLVNNKCSSRHKNILKKYKDTYKVDGDNIIELIKNKSEDIEIYINVPHLHVINIAKDTHYRNQFETNVSRGTFSHSGRRIWEKKLFNYSPDVSGFNRPKYGNLPIQNSNGTNFNQRVSIYGNCYFILKKHVRDRTTITAGDSGGMSLDKVFNFEHFHLIGETYIEEIKSFIDLGKISNYYSYIETQIHGPVRLDTDVEKFCYPRDYYEELRDSICKLKKKGILCSSF
jgi:hypothetical protein